ncbi:Remorin 4.1 [Zea mays]|uniref:Remorin 4.1 n=1 Tax=Zea mays TaxID=4577 RepID=A0A3L6FVW1_MAIZE|nr:Remorin 4.1 [Zea mays]
MEYERIHQKAQPGALSPTKLRMKILGAHNRVRVITSNSSSRTSPAKTIEASQAQNRLLVCDVLEEDSADSTKHPSATNKTEAVEKVQKDPAVDISQVQNASTSSAAKPATGSSSMIQIHPLRPAEEDSTTECDSGLDNASTSSFEFHGVEKAAATQNQAAGYLSRQTSISSKWNDAEKWIVSRQNVSQKNNVAKGALQNQTTVNQMSSAAARGAVVPKISARPVQKMKRVNPALSAPRSILERLSFASYQPKLVRHADVCPVSNAGANSEHHKATDSGSLIEVKPCNDTNDIPTVQSSVSVRDVGTEMTPIPSQEPSRTGTPLGSRTPTRSPNCSVPSTPVGGRSIASPPGEDCTDDGPFFHRKCGIHANELSDTETRLKTRQEIAALGIQLGKMNIATWASKEELELVSAAPSIADLERIRKEYAARAASYEEAENTKHTARFKKEEVKIEAWEGRQRAKIEYEMRRIEEFAERMRSEAMEKMAEKLEMTRRIAEEKRASANAKMNQQAAIAVQKAEKIRQTGRVPGSSILRCGGCFCGP